MNFINHNKNMATNHYKAWQQNSMEKYGKVWQKHRKVLKNMAKNPDYYSVKLIV